MGSNSCGESIGKIYRDVVFLATNVYLITRRYHKEKDLPHLDKIKYFVPKQLTMGQFVSVIRMRMKLTQEQSLYFLINNKRVVSMTSTMQQVYDEMKDDDGFVYMTYASLDMFG